MWLVECEFYVSRAMIFTRYYELPIGAVQMQFSRQGAHVEQTR